MLLFCLFFRSLTVSRTLLILPDEETKRLRFFTFLHGGFCFIFILNERDLKDLFSNNDANSTDAGW